MGLFDFFKKTKKEEIKKVKKEPKKKDIKKEEKIAPVSVGKKEKKLKAQAIKPRKKVLGESYRILHSPHVTEKATDLTEENKYVFKVLAGANKIEIKKAVENTYGIDVVAVRIINIHRKKRKFRGQVGWSQGYKKAIVKVKKGQKIEILPR